MTDKIRITRRLLDDYRKLKREIPLLETEMEEMKRGDNGLGSSTINDYRTGQARPQSVVGFDWKLYEHRQSVLNHKKDKVEAVEKWIDAIEDGQTRCVFKMFYVDGMGWARIAVKTGYAESPDYPRLHIRDEYLKRCRII